MGGGAWAAAGPATTSAAGIAAQAARRRGVRLPVAGVVIVLGPAMTLAAVGGRTADRGGGGAHAGSWGRLHLPWRLRPLAAGNGGPGSVRPMTPRTVLITGCSTGIGRACAERLARAGHTVYATARRLESIEDLRAAGCRTLALDVTDEASMRAAVEAVEAEAGAVGALVNNAGYSQSGAVESLSMEDLRRQFETNVFGLVRMCQLVLPGMRGQAATAGS